MQRSGAFRLSVAGAALACAVLLLTLGVTGSGAQPAAGGPERPLVFVPGLLGSMLCRPGPEGEQTVVWGTLEAIGQFPELAVTSDGGDVTPCGLIREVSFLGVFTQAVYGPFIDRLQAAGYRPGESLFIFDYDWRQSVFANAERLGAFVEAQVPGNGEIDVVGHSMGGLIARIYALEGGGSARIVRLLSAGTPWRGSVQVFELLHDGLGLANPLLGGIETVRRTIVSFPSSFELMPDYEGCCGDAGAVAFEATDAEAWTALNWSGIDAGALPDLDATAARQARLRDILAMPMPAQVEEALVLGVDQRTPQHYVLEPGEGEARLEVRTSWEGDGTVMRDSALLPQRVSYPTSFATHDAILNEASVQDFVLAVLAHGPEAARATVPVRERSSILTALGKLVQLVGVAIATDQPAYLTDGTARVTVHLRLDVDDAVDADTITLAVVTPGDGAASVPVTADPGASEPTVPLEQSFSAVIGTGGTAGDLLLRVTIDAPSGQRVVTRVVPVLPREDGSHGAEVELQRR